MSDVAHGPLVVYLFTFNVVITYESILDAFIEKNSERFNFRINTYYATLELYYLLDSRSKDIFL